MFVTGNIMSDQVIDHVDQRKFDVGSRLTHKTVSRSPDNAVDVHDGGIIVYEMPSS